MNTIDIIKSIRQTTVAFLFVLLAFPLSARENGNQAITDSVFSFNFPVKTKQDFFYSPGYDNGEELEKLFSCVKRYKKLITDHKIYVYVNGYSNSNMSASKDLAVAKIRSNRVKSELITRQGLTEGCFITRNHAGEGNFVKVSFVVPKELIQSMEEEEKNEGPQEPPKEEAVEDIRNEQEEAGEPEVAPTEESSEESTTPLPAPETVEGPYTEKRDGRFILKTNLLDYAILMPNLEIEWKFKDRWSLALELQSAWYAKETPHKVYRLATLMPEVRYWVIDRSRWHGMYVGLFGGAGMYDLCNGKKGHEGEAGMVGVSTGYMWPISKHFSLDAGIGLGYMRIRDKVYLPLDGHFLYQYTKNINYIGPLRLKLSLVWRLQYTKTIGKK